MSAIQEILERGVFSRDDLVALLSVDRQEELDELCTAAYAVKLREVGATVYFRGLIELSNICVKNCHYCGIRRGNPGLKRYQLSEEEVFDGARFALDSRYGSVVLQAGERQDAPFIDFIERVARGIKDLSGGRLGITLSLGEQSRATYARWFAAGAHRYLLRIETSNRDLYRRLHPADHDFDERLRALDDLKVVGFQVGTGVMVGLPGQSLADLADDLLFFRERDIDMIGMGPYIPHHDTPMADSMPDFDKVRQFHLGIKMIACTRLFLKDVNIAAATALQALDPNGRELGLAAGANVIMPNTTDTRYRAGYQLYDDKPGLDENAASTRAGLEARIAALGETIGYDQWGDSPHFRNRRVRG